MAEENSQDLLAVPFRLTDVDAELVAQAKQVEHRLELLRVTMDLIRVCPDEQRFADFALLQMEELLGFTVVYEPQDERRQTTTSDDSAPADQRHPGPSDASCAAASPAVDQQ